MNAFETALLEIAKLFLWPVLALIVLALAFALLSLGAFLCECLLRRAGRYRPILPRLATRMAEASSDDLELAIMRRLEPLRIVSRTAPMLGLVATMIPMGPALLALSKGNAGAVGENLVVAFSAVILALVSASITFLILTVRRRWLLEELRQIERGAADAVP